MFGILKFRNDNIMSPQRTPWGGKRIPRVYRAGERWAQFDKPVGESWDFSVFKEFPSRELETDRPLYDILDTESASWLSAGHISHWGKSTPMLIKTIDAAMDLSVQIHPPVEAEIAEQGMSGKWEAWYVLHAEPNAGIYLGFQPHVTLDRLRETLYSHGDLRDDLRFVPVHAHEMVMIPPGVVHALGKGVSVVEPQVMKPGKNGLTLRLYDWNRRYNAEGSLDENGAYRPLHVEAGLNWVNLERNVMAADDFVLPAVSVVETPSFCVRKITIRNELVFFVLQGTGRATLSLPSELKSLITLEGRCTCRSAESSMAFATGESGMISAQFSEIEFDCASALCFVTCMLPHA